MNCHTLADTLHTKNNTTNLNINNTFYTDYKYSKLSKF